MSLPQTVSCLVPTPNPEPRTPNPEPRTPNPQPRTAKSRLLCAQGRRQGKEVIDRCNLTVLSEPGQENLPQFLADNQV
jgi:hypothetical protein